MKKNESDAGFGETLSRFLARNRSPFIILIVVLVLAGVATIVVDRYLEERRTQSDLLSEDLQKAFIDWMTASEEERSSADLEEMIERGLEDYPRFFAARRALFTRGLMAVENEEWRIAADSFQELADSWPESYLAPISLFNVGSSLEELGDLDGAEAAWNSLVNGYSGESPDLPEALFNLGRLAESRGDMEEAVERYRVLESRFSDSRWTNLGKSRIIDIESGL